MRKPRPLVARASSGHKPSAVEPPEIFDRRARRRARNRAAASAGDADFLREHMLGGIVERLEAAGHDFTDILDIGAQRGTFAWPGAKITRIDAGDRFASLNGGICGEEDRLPLGEARFDLVVSAASLDQVNDLPGALSLIARALRPGGLFVAAFAGAGTLATLRQALRVAEPEPPAPRLHPQIDVRSAGDLLMRAGFADPVADTETLTVRYSGLARLIADLRGMAATNLLHARRPISRTTLARLTQAYADLADSGGKTAERFEIVYMTGRAPDPDCRPRKKGGRAYAAITAGLPPPV